MFKKSIIYSLVGILCLGSTATFGYEVRAGYGRSKDTNHREDTNSGFLISGEIFPTLGKVGTLNFSGLVSMGNWFSSTHSNDYLFTGAVSLAARLFFSHSASFRPYLEGTGGPAFLSNRKFGQNVQGSNFAFQVTLGGGFQIIKNGRGIDLNLQWVHYSNANLFKPNEGFNFLYLVSLGYIF